MIIKVCGLRDPGNAKQVSDIPGVSLIGMIFYLKSPRYVEPGPSSESLAALNQVDKVGVFVNEIPDVIVRKCESYRLDYLQLHGNETPQYLVELKKKVPAGVKIIKAFPVGTAEDLEAVADYEGHCDLFLFDTPASSYGGSGKMFDWGVLEEYLGKTPFLLSGGLGPESADLLAEFKHPLFAGIDVNSRFELEPGMKNVPLLREFVQKMIAANNR